jgi:hypothetical protein
LLVNNGTAKLIASPGAVRLSNARVSAPTESANKFDEVESEICRQLDLPPPEKKSGGLLKKLFSSR